MEYTLIFLNEWVHSALTVTKKFLKNEKISIFSFDDNKIFRDIEHFLTSIHYKSENLEAKYFSLKS